MKLPIRSTLVLTWVGYAATYFLRKPLGIGKSGMQRDLQLSSAWLGLLDTAMLMPYALVQTLFGSWGDKMGPRLTLVMGLVVSGLAMLTFGQWTSPLMLCFLLFVNGASQSLAWGACVKSLSNSYESTHHPTVMGILSTSSFAGGVGASYLAVRLLQIGGWQNMFYYPSALCIAVGIVIYFALPDLLVNNNNNNNTDNIKDEKDSNAPSASSSPPPAASSSSSQGMSFREMFNIKMLPEVTVAFLCIKLVRYAFLLWLPMYLYQVLKYPEASAGLVSMAYEIGGVAGSGGIGIVVTKVFKGRDVAAASFIMLAAAISMVLFSLTSSWGVPMNVFFILLTGAFSCAVDPIVSGTVPIKFAQLANTGVSKICTFYVCLYIFFMFVCFSLLKLAWVCVCVCVCVF